MTKPIKIMAYYNSTGIWTGSRQIKLSKIVRNSDEKLEKALLVWQAFYDVQFMKYPFNFDWDDFNQDGRELAKRIQASAKAGVEVYYADSDDREFFYSDNCSLEEVTRNFRNREDQFYGV